MQKLALLAPAFVFALSACGGNSAPADRDPPKVATTYPSLFKTMLRVDGSILVLFSEKINPATLSAIRLEDGVGNATPVTVDGSGVLVTVKPVSVLAPNAAYSLVVPASVTDVAGNKLGAAYKESFTTEPVPTKVKLVSFVPNSYGTATVSAQFINIGTEEAPSIWLKATCKEDGYSNLTTYLKTATSASRWLPGEVNTVFLQYSSGFSYFTGNSVSCQFSSDDEANSRRVIIQ